MPKDIRLLSSILEHAFPGGANNIDDPDADASRFRPSSEDIE